MFLGRGWFRVTYVWGVKAHVNPYGACQSTLLLRDGMAIQGRDESFRRVTKIHSIIVAQLNLRP